MSVGVKACKSDDFMETLLGLVPLLFAVDAEGDLRRIRTTALSLLPELKAQMQFPGWLNEAYGRRVLYSTRDLEIMLACWRPQSECAPHDHGFSQGRVLALGGSFIESDFGWRDENLVRLGGRAIESLSALPVDLGHIHSMKCNSDNGLTLHFYRPAISQMKVFDLEKRRTLMVTDDCGAWIPQPHQIVTAEPWKK